MKDFLKNKKNIIWFCILAAVIIGFLCYVCTHTFIDGRIYANSAENLDLQGQVSAKVKGGTLSAQGDQMAELKSTGPVTVKGAIVKVN